MTLTLTIAAAFFLIGYGAGYLDRKRRPRLRAIVKPISRADVIQMAPRRNYQGRRG